MKNILVFASAVALSTPPPVQTPAPTVIPTIAPSAAPAGLPTTTPSPGKLAASPAPGGALTLFSGQILDLRGGFVFFTTGDGFRLDPNYRTVDAATKQATNIPATTRTYACASFNQAGLVQELALSRKPLPQQASYGDIRRFAVALSTPYPNPDLDISSASSNGNEHYTGREVLVRFTVQVPPTTPLTDDVYISTDQSQWDPMAIKLLRVDALHYRIDRPFRSGVKLLYRYTRGTWRSAERGRDALEEPPRAFVVPESDTKNRSDVVYHWSDENQSSSENFVNAIPTPMNQSPFVTPPTAPRP